VLNDKAEATGWSYIDEISDKVRAENFELMRAKASTIWGAMPTQEHQFKIKQCGPYLPLPEPATPDSDDPHLKDVSSDVPYYELYAYIVVQNIWNVI
jgi:hypothetical protein